MALANSGEYGYPEEQGQTDAQLQNRSDRNVRQYRDLELYFGKKSGNKDIGKVTDIQAVKRSIRNLVLLNRYEKPFQPFIFGGVLDSLFEPIEPLTAHYIGKQIEDVIVGFEPRALLDAVEVIENVDNNAYDVKIYFRVINIPAEQVELEFMLERLR